jgi:isoquinoline 1-oxidoreductase alpha subunit
LKVSQSFERDRQPDYPILSLTKIDVTINGAKQVVEVDDDTPLLWILRDTLGLTGTKYGCGVGVCGACTILENGEAVRSCQIPGSEASGRTFTTIEALSSDGSHPCQKAWIEQDVAQCGFCQPGMIMAACALLKKHPTPTDADIDEAMSESVCRCGTYPRMRKAIHRASQAMLKSAACSPQDESVRLAEKPPLPVTQKA